MAVESTLPGGTPQDLESFAIYTYGDPACLFQLRLAGVRWVRPVQNLDFARLEAPPQRLPSFVLGRVVRFLEYLIYDRQLDLSRFGVEPDQFGSAMVSNIGNFEGFGMSFALAPLVSYLREHPRSDRRRIVFLDTFHEFPFDTTRALELAFFKTFASPSIAEPFAPPASEV